MGLAEDIKRIADALEEMARPVEMEEMPDMPVPVCPYCQAEDPTVLVTASDAARANLSVILGLTVECLCLSCNKPFMLKPLGMAIEK